MLKKKILITLFYLLLVFMSGCSYYNTDIEKYLKGFPKDRHLYRIFPEDLTKVEIVENYILYNKFLVGYLVYLEVTYSEQMYNEEINRLNDFTFENYGHEIKRLKYDDCFLFNYPTFVAEYNSIGDYQYASIVNESERRIIYVFLYAEAEKKKGNISNNYLPKNYSETMSGYSNYRYSINNLIKEDKWYDYEPDETQSTDSASPSA